MKNKVIRTAIASYGMSGYVFHAPFIHLHPGFELKKILERTKSLSKERYPYAKIVRDYDELVADPDIDLVIVNTPDHLHYPMALAALHAGKHVVVEKPFTQTSQQGEELIALARQKGVLLTVYHNRRFDGDSRTVQKILKEGLLGRLVDYAAHYDRYHNFIPKTWKEDPSTGASIVYNLGSHLIDHALFLFGKPESVWADIRKVRDGALTDDYFEIKLLYQSFSATLKSSYLVKEPGPRYILHGTDGSYIKSGNDPQEEALKQGEWPEGERWGMEPESDWGLLHAEKNNISVRKVIPTLPGNYMDFYTNLYEAVVQGAPLTVKPEEGLEVIRIIEKAYLSNLEKRNIMV